MKSLLFGCLLGTFLASGMCLECDICLELGQKCTNALRKTCAAGEDTCITFQTEVIRAPLTITFTSKACGTSDTCHHEYVETTLHHDLRLRSKLACCTGEECQTRPPLVLEPQVNLSNRSNGLQCPGCIGLTSTKCTEHLVSCQASENQCLSITKKSSEFLFREMSVKGCASESMCNLLEKNFWGSLANLEVDIKCTPALPQSS